jgi:tetratricopeptide (TPR) repeat protein
MPAKAADTNQPENLVNLRPLLAIANTIREVSKGHRPDPAYRRRAVRSVRAGGEACVPLLVRAFRGGDEELRVWAGFLLLRLGGARVVRELSALLRDITVEDDVKTRALSLLGDLGAPAPDEIVLKDSDLLIERSVRELLAGLRTRADVRQAADLVVAQIAAEELAFFCQEVLKHGGRRARRLVQAIGDSDLPDAVATEVQGLLGQSETVGPLLVVSCTRRVRRRQASALEHGLARLSDGDAAGALPFLRQFARLNPNDVEGSSSLGVCLLALGRPQAAIPHLSRACRASPDEALHHWNLAAAAQKAGRVGACYLALRAYLAADNHVDDDPERLAEARSYVEEYERAVGSDHADLDPCQFAQGEDLFLSAFAAFEERKFDDAAKGFERVLSLLPEHFAAWAHLGTTYGELGMREQAIDCLERALELRPGFAPAHAQLLRLKQLPPSA